MSTLLDRFAGAAPLFRKELLRFWKVAFQTVAAPVMRQTGLTGVVMGESLPRGRGIVHRPGRPIFPEPCMRGVSRWTDPTGVGGSA